MNRLLIIIILLWACSLLFSQEQAMLARVQFDGGGDWYNDPELLPNLAKYANDHINTNFTVKDKNIRLNDKRLFEYPFLFLTGHGNIKLTEEEVVSLRNHLERGAMLYADDDYGMDESFRREMKRVFPDKSLVELPQNHPLFFSYYSFPQGLPKIHEHDKKRPQLYAIFSDEGRILVLYSFESNISDGWGNADTHDDPPEVKEKAFQFGTNILYYFFSGSIN